MTLIEVLFYDHIGQYYPGQVVELSDGPFLRSILRGGKADVLNPPDWDPDDYPEFSNGAFLKLT